MTSWLFMFFKALKVKAKLYHLHDPELIPTAILLKLMGKKVVFDIHENIAEDIFDKEWIRFPRLYYGIFAFFEFFVTKFVFVILAEKSYAKRYKSRAKNYAIVYNYCKYDFFKRFQNKQRDPYKLFYSGILFENRGVLQIAEAIHILKEKGIEIEFHCVGALYYELRIKLESLPFYSEIEGNLHFYGRQKLEKAYTLGKNCGIGLSIIHPMSNSVESYPTKIFEYMACGISIIASDFPLYKTIVEEKGCGRNVNPLSSVDLAKAIQSIIADDEGRKKAEEQGILLAKETYNWESEEDKLFKIYDKLCVKS